MGVSGGWSVEELRDVWRALSRLPDDHVAGATVREIVRAGPAPDGAAGLERYARWDATGGRLLLHDAALGAQVTPLTLDEAVARAVGRACWRRYRAASFIEDEDTFARLYARFYLDREGLGAEAPDQLTRLAAALPEADTAGDPGLAHGPVHWIVDAVRRPHAAEGVAEAQAERSARAYADVHLGPGPWRVRAAPPPLSDPDALAPWRFLLAERPADARDPIPQRWAVACDGLGLAHGRHGHGGAFERLCADLAEEGALAGASPVQLVAAWHALTRGYYPEQVTARPGEVPARGEAPPVGVAAAGREEDTGALVFVGWTQRAPSRLGFERHWLRIAPDGRLLGAQTTLAAPT